jgi:LuxR family maltose regulon positive regulatory protein
LQARLQQEEQSRWIELHRRAANWFEVHKRPEEAVHHYLTVGAHEDAARVMGAAAQDMFYAGRLGTLTAWGAALPAPLRERAPRLALFQSRAADMLGQWEEALALTEVAERGYRADEDTQGLAYALLHRGRVWQGPGRFQEAHLRQALTYSLEQGSDFEQASIQDGLADCLWRQGRWVEAVAVQRQAVATRQRLGNPGALAGVLNDLGFYLYSTGEYCEALRLFEEALELARRCGHRRREALTLLSLAELTRDLGALERAVEACEGGLAIADELGDGFLSAYGREALGLVHRCRSDYPLAQAAIEQAMERAERQRSEYQLGRYGASLGLVRAEAGEVKAGLAELARACERLERIGAHSELARAQFFTAWALFRAGREAEALATLQQVLAMADPPSREFLFVVEGQRTLPLLERAHAQGIGGEKLSALLARARAFEHTAQAVLQQQASSPEAEAEEPLRIFGFGQGRVERGGKEIPPSDWEAASVRQLLFYLLAHSPRSRDQIAAVIWPDLPAPRAKATFHTAKFRLKRALGREAIYFDGRRYQVHPDMDYWFDVAEFERLLEGTGAGRRVEQLQQAITLYQGDFLEDCYADWCLLPRERLRERCLEALDELAGRLLVRRQYRQAIQTLRRGLEMDDLREKFYRQLMRAYALSGRRSQAFAQYQRCAGILERELGTAPSPATTALYRRILDGLPLD